MQLTHRRKLLVAIAGLSTGGIFLYLAVDEVSTSELLARVDQLNYAHLLFGAALYWCALLMRVFRWQALLRELGPAPLVLVAETLVVGYAVNNLLPARLGEFARAAYARRRLGTGSVQVFGSIVIERVLDLVAILACLGGGLLAWQFAGSGAAVAAFELIAVNAAVVIAVLLVAIVMLRRGYSLGWRWPARIEPLVARLQLGLRSLNRRSAALALAITPAIWLFEVSALAQVFAAAGVVLSGAEAALLMGAASLSTLVPTAPGYLGTYQLVAVLAMTTFGYAESSGIVASTAIQLVLFGSVSVAGCLIVGLRALARLWDVRGGRSDSDKLRCQSASEKGVKSVSSS